MWAMEVHGWSWGAAPYILNFGIRWRWVISFLPCPGYRWGEICLYSLNRSNRAGMKCFAEETNLSALLTVKQQCVSHPACIKQNTNSMSLSDCTMKVSNWTQTVCHCQTVHQLHLFTIIICLTVMNHYSLLLWVMIVRLVKFRTCNDINQSGISQRFEYKQYRNEHFYG